MAWTFYELARNPETLVELRREIASAVGVGAEAREPTYKDLKSMKFVSHVLSETLRLLPNTPFNIRAAPKHTSLPRGGGPDDNDPVGLRAGTQVIF
ncbi:Cytochrome P450 52A13 [Colletotrichum orbiculare MAFF 240422]|uniref:Cytochrome P450 52A13 n=1 Tax=Colletotrichum orbiculare (strain 104-T / ATCC 96160 / CBS 514.97 / LARS 414 / MAFF 240422) TaxID=1213857 RepID=A0A484FFT6_COLOR|nr:Cytochrome P450 52A13 [Colletotrichum orbiculare MAFF 240422]